MENEKQSGHRKIIYWQNIDKIDILVQTILKQIPIHAYKLRSQIDNASDSAEANFVEGYYSGSTGEYLRFLRYSRRSIAELQVRVKRIHRKGYVSDNLYHEFEDLIIKTGYLGDRLISSLEKKLQGNK
ncbi:MAG: four helix bundle protein [Candidatus Uhrbacteria bacterium]|nr:four helix bundle protein [Patescibacteria group bacterium]MBU1906929.1 four helix bundle protein [Patescibacteria group bacterium]